MTPPEAIGIGLGFLAIAAPDFWPKMPKSFSYILAGAGLSWLVFSGVLALQDVTDMKLSHGPLALIVIGAIFAGSGIFWHIHLKKSGEENRESVPKILPVATAPQPTLETPTSDNFLELSCSPENDFKLPPAGRFYALEANYKDDNEIFAGFAATG
jgi:hypothetical protein